MRRLALLLPILAVCLTTAAQAQASVPASDEANPTTPTAVDLMWGVKIPMRDGVHLNATVYRPQAQAQSDFGRGTASSSGFSRRSATSARE
jgi:hypothetical protein